MRNDITKIHPKFQLNGISYSETEIKLLAYNFLQKGETFEQNMGKFLLEWLNDKPTIALYTSGSTGTPKSIVLQKRHMFNSACATGDFFKIKAGDSALLCLPIEYIAGKMMLVRALVLGWCLDYVVPSSNPLENTKKTYDFCAMVPLQLQSSLPQVEQIKTLIIGGAALTTPLKNSVQQKRTKVYETYGMTETITHIAVKKVNHRNDSATNDSFRAISGVIFSSDERDCLVICAPKVSEHPIITNDIVKLFSETEFNLLGRFDNVINSGGVKLHPEQIEAKLAPFIPYPFFVTGLKDEVLGQKLILVVESTADSDVFLNQVNDIASLERFEIPKEVYVLPKFSTTRTGKIDRINTLKLV